MIPALGQSPGGGNDNLLQYSCLKNPMIRRTWQGYSSWGYKESDKTEHEYEWSMTGQNIKILDYYAIKVGYFSKIERFHAWEIVLLFFASVWKLQGLEWMARLFKHWERSFSNSSPSSINDQGTGSPQSLLMQENSLIFLTNLFQVPLQQLA